MTANSVLVYPQGLRSGARVPTCPLATPLDAILKKFKSLIFQNQHKKLTFTKI